MGFKIKKEVPKIMKLKEVKEVVPTPQVEEESSKKNLEELEEELAKATADVEKKKEEAKQVVEEEKVEFRVVSQLPTQEVRRYTEEDGTIIQLITIEEALTKIMNQ